MIPQALARRLALVLTLGALVAAAALAQQKHRLRAVDLAGDLSSVESTLEMALDIQAQAAGQTVPPMKFTNHEEEKYTEEVLSLDAKGRSGLRRIYTVARTVETDPNGRKENTATRQGKTVAIRRKAGKVVVTSTPGTLDEEERKSLLDDLENDTALFFPDREVGPGDEWSVDPKKVTGMFDGVDSASLLCRFEEVTDHAGYRCARLKMTLELAGQPEGMPGRLTMKLEGSGYYALDIERPVALDLAGPITLKGETKENGLTVTFTGEGSFKARETRQWLKLGGKPLPAKAPPP